MDIPDGVFKLGPDTATLAVRTGRTGAAAKAGHNLLLHVTTWEATLTVAGGTASITLEADGSSLVVIEGTGGMQSLGDDDRASIKQTIDDEVLRCAPIAFRSTAASASASGLAVEGELTIGTTPRPIAFTVMLVDGSIAASATLRQTDFGIKPYSTLFGALKVVDEVEVSIAGSTA